MPMDISSMVVVVILRLLTISAIFSHQLFVGRQENDLPQVVEEPRHVHVFYDGGLVQGEGDVPGVKSHPVAVLPYHLEAAVALVQDAPGVAGHQYRVQVFHADGDHGGLDVLDPLVRARCRPNWKA